MEGNALLFIAIIIFSSKLLSRLFQKIKLPPVLAMILIGIAIGPTGLNLLQSANDIEIVKFFAKIGVIILLFLAGLETDLKEIKNVGKNSLLIALGGILLPFILGGGITLYFFNGNLNAAIIMGLIATATSVSVSVMTLMNMGKLKSVEGTTIVNAAIIDDIIGIILLSITLGMIESQGASWWETIFTVSKLVGYFIIIFIVGIFILPLLSKIFSKLKIEMIIISFVFFCMFLFAWFAEKTDIAAITGAYFTGVFFGRLKDKHKIEEGVRNIGHTLFVSVFFVFIGIQTDLRNLAAFSLPVIIFIILYILLAIFSKIIGSGGIAKIIGFDFKRSFRIGSGMTPRGEVALIIASIALAKGSEGMINEQQFTAVIAMVIFTAAITPFLIRLGFHEKQKKEDISVK